MIILCEKCRKNFEVDPLLIPDQGRLLKCSSCKHEWFYKKESLKNIEINSENENDNVLLTKDENSKIVNENINGDLENQTSIKKEILNKGSSKTKKNKINILRILLVFLISFFTLLLLVETFKNSISLIYPDINLILSSLYEVYKDIFLFIKDLTK